MDRSQVGLFFPDILSRQSITLRCNSAEKAFPAVKDEVVHSWSDLFPSSLSIIVGAGGPLFLPLGTGMARLLGDVGQE